MSSKVGLDIQTRLIERGFLKLDASLSAYGGDELLDLQQRVATAIEEVLDGSVPGWRDLPVPERPIDGPTLPFPEEAPQSPPAGRKTRKKPPTETLLTEPPAESQQELPPEQAAAVAE